MNRIGISLLVSGISLCSNLHAIQTHPLPTLPLQTNNSLAAKTYRPVAAPGNLWNQYKLSRTALGIGVHGTTLTMDDQTVWEIAPSSAYTAKMWRAGTSFIIYPNNETIGLSPLQYPYVLFNEASGEWIEARLSEGPFVHYALLTHDIDYYNGFVYLGDGSIWKINPTPHNFSRLRSWKERQAILVGRNTGWFAPNQLLINVNENNSISVDFYGFQ